MKKNTVCFRISIIINSNNYVATGHCGKYRNTLYVPRETGNNAYAKFGGQTEYYGIFQSGLLLLTGCSNINLLYIIISPPNQKVRTLSHFKTRTGRRGEGQGVVQSNLQFFFDLRQEHHPYHV